jgi:hypothetical protein
MPERPARVPGPNVLALVWITLLLANYFGSFADLDFAWQIRTGEQIVRHATLRPPEGFTYTIAGQSIPDFEWLYELLLWAVWNAFGYGGLKLLKVLCVAAPLVLLGMRLRREGVRWYGIAVALFVAIAVLAPAWNLRPLYCTTVGLLLVSGWLHDHCNGRRPLTWWLPVVLLLWANLHPGVILAQGLLCGAIAWEWLNRRVRLNTPLDAAACRRLTLIGGLGVAATFVSPDPVERLLYPFKPELAHPVMRIFTEMQPLYRFAGTPPYLTNLAYVVAGLVALTVVLRFRQYRLWEVALLGGLAVLGNAAFRSLQDWLLVMLALGVPHLAVLLRQAMLAYRRAGRPGRQTLAARALRVAFRFDRGCKHVLSAPLFRFHWFWPVATVALLAIVSLIPALGRRVPGQDATEWPVGLGHWLEANEVHGRFFAPPDYGSYLTWRLGDRARCYVDTRGFFFPPVLLEDSCFVPQMMPDWRDRLERVLGYGTDYFALETTGPRGALWQALRSHVEPLYVDGKTVLLSSDQVRQGVRRLGPAATGVSLLK